MYEERLENAVLFCTRAMAGMVSEEVSRKKKEWEKTAAIEEEVRILEIEERIPELKDEVTKIREQMLHIEQGGSPKALKTILGHSGLSMTMDLYSHVLPNTKQEEMNSINIALWACSELCSRKNRTPIYPPLTVRMPMY